MKKPASIPDRSSEAGVALFELFSVEELESRLEFNRRRRKPHGISSVGHGHHQLNPCLGASHDGRFGFSNVPR